MEAHGLNASHWGKEPLFWYEGCSFTSLATSKRVAFHVGDYMKLTSGELVLIPNEHDIDGGFQSRFNLGS